MKTLFLAALAAGAFLLARDASSQTDTNTVASRGSSGSRRTMLRPVILTQSGSQTISAGSTVSLSVAFDSVLPRVTSGKLELWLKADAGVVTDAFARVRQWQDQSENRNDALQPSAALEPLLVFPPALAGRAAIRFEGMLVAYKPSFLTQHISIGPYLEGYGQVDVSGALTSFCVHMLAAASTLENLLWVAGEPKIFGEGRCDVITDDVMRFSFWGCEYDADFMVPGGRYRIRADRLAAGLNSLEMFDITPASTNKFSLQTSGARPLNPGYYVGGCDPVDKTFGRNLNGDIAELIIYQGALDDADLLAVTDYLQDKYFPAERMDGAAFQWRFDGTNIAGATNATLVLTNVQPALAGAYSVMVSNAAAIVFSSNAAISVTASRPSRSP
jgi:hypothetical protein